MARLLVVALACLLAPAAPAAASHMTAYHSNPVERDDQGRSDEPDFAATAVLGPALENRILDLDRDGVAVPDRALPPPPGRAAVLAPGCSDDAGRQPSGLCGLYTAGPLGDVLPPVCGVQNCGQPPGAYTPTRDTVIRFLDARVDLMPSTLAAGMLRLDVHHKFADALGPHHPGAMTLGPAGIWAWLGDWQDKNGNGVIDHTTDAQGQAPPHNEFVWLGGCRPFSGNPPPDQQYCRRDPLGATMLGYSFPGNHHSRCGLAPFDLAHSCAAIGADLPGAMVPCLANAVLGGGAVPLLAGRCASGAGLFGGEAGHEGDPLLGDQGLVGPDEAFGDRTGDPSPETRGWFLGQGWPVWYYDQSLLVGHVFVAAYGAPADPAHANAARLAEARFLDVDRHRALSPEAEAVLQGQVKPALRGHFQELARLTLDADRFARAAARDADHGARALTGPGDDAAWDPGWSHEPNHPADEYPGAVRGADCPDGTARHHGWCNDYAAHRAGPRAWLDLRSFREATAHRAIAFPPFSCIMCVTGPGLSTTASPEPMPGHGWPRAPGDHARALGPGIHHFFSAVGTWHDQPSTAEELSFDPATLSLVAATRSAGPDGWVGSLLDLQPGAPRTHGGAPEDTCTIGGVTRSYPWVWCHPYLDGAISDPNRYAAPEWTGTCPGGWPPPEVELRPEGGVWGFPVFVWRDTWVVGLVPRLEEHTGRAAPIRLVAWCIGPHGVLGSDVLVLPLGNLGQRVTSTLAIDVPTPGGVERVVDVDLYEAIGA